MNIIETCFFKIEQKNVFLEKRETDLFFKQQPLPVIE